MELRPKPKKEAKNKEDRDQEMFEKIYGKSEKELKEEQEKNSLAIDFLNFSGVTQGLNEAYDLSQR